MKNKIQLLQELTSFGSFVTSLTDLSEEFLRTPLFESFSIKKLLVSIHLQDVLYLNEYFPHMSKNASLQGHDKEKFFQDVEDVYQNYSSHEIIDKLFATRNELVSFLHGISQEQIHATFTIDGAPFTMYDYIKRIIWNDSINKDKILKAII